MMLLVALIVLVISMSFLIVDSFRRDQRRKKIALYVEDHTHQSPSMVNRFFVRIGKEHRHELEQKMIEAGYYNTEWAKFYFPAKLLVLALVSGAVLFSGMEQRNQLIFITFTLITVIVGPDSLLQIRRKLLIRKTSAQLPYLLDMMSVCVQTCITIEAALVYLG